MNLIGHEIQGYIIDKKINEGGMASVFEATNTLGKKRAIKVLKSEFSERNDVRNRFTREAKILASLQHENIVSVEDYKNEGAILSISMEYLQGEDLESALSRRSFNQEEQLSIIHQILAAFQYAHDRHIVHRDVKPSNIFLTETGIIKILDFGIAKILEGDMQIDFTKTKTFLGTPEFMSPEQTLSSKHIDERSDIYSLGVLLYTICTGKSPYRHLRQSPSGLAELVHLIQNVNLDGTVITNYRLRKAIEKATQKDPIKRFQTVSEFVEMIFDDITIVEESIDYDFPKEEHNVPETDFEKNRKQGDHHFNLKEWKKAKESYLLALRERDDSYTSLQIKVCEAELNKSKRKTIGIITVGIILILIVFSLISNINHTSSSNNTAQNSTAEPNAEEPTIVEQEVDTNTDRVDSITEATNSEPNVPNTTNDSTVETTAIVEEIDDTYSTYSRILTHAEAKTGLDRLNYVTSSLISEKLGIRRYSDLKQRFNQVLSQTYYDLIVVLNDSPDNQHIRICNLRNDLMLELTSSGILLNASYNQQLIDLCDQIEIPE